MRHLGTIILKEWAETIRNKLLLAGIFVLPAVFLLVPLLILYGVGLNPVDQRAVAQYVEESPALARLSPLEVLQTVLINEFLFFFLLTPSVIPMTLASFSIIGEKQAHSLEPLLATPVTTAELLLGKAIAAVTPAVAVTWLAYSLFVLGARLITTDRVMVVLLNTPWLLAMIVIGPLVAVLSVLLGVIISSRVNDTRVAQQVGGLVALPIAGFAVAQASGSLLLNLESFVIGASALIALDAAVFYLAVRLFQRDRILTTWK